MATQGSVAPGAQVLTPPPSPTHQSARPEPDTVVRPNAREIQTQNLLRAASLNSVAGGGGGGGAPVAQPAAMAVDAEAAQAAEEARAAEEAGAGAGAGAGAMAVDVEAAQAAEEARAAEEAEILGNLEALADFAYNSANDEEISAIKVICNSQSPISEAQAIYYFKNQPYFIDYCDEFIERHNENYENYKESYDNLHGYLQRESLIGILNAGEISMNIYKKGYSMLLINIPSAKYDYYIFDCLREIVDDENQLFYSGPRTNIFDNELKKAHIFYYLQYIGLDV
jgi:hypothetical protein